MGWQAHTGYTKIDVGTSLRLIESATVSGEIAAPILEGSEMGVHFPVGNVIVVTVAAVNDTEIVIQEPDGKRWRLTPWTANDASVDFDTSGLNHQDWVVRSEMP